MSLGAPSLEKKVRRLEEQNNNLRLTVRRQESEIQRLKLTRGGAPSHRQSAMARRASHQIEELQGLSERYESELAEARHRLTVFQRETFALRSLVKYADHPELADAAMAEAGRLMLQEELRSALETIRVVEQERDVVKGKYLDALDALDDLQHQNQQQSSARKGSVSEEESQGEKAHAVYAASASVMSSAEEDRDSNSKRSSTTSSSERTAPLGIASDEVESLQSALPAKRRGCHVSVQEDMDTGEEVSHSGRQRDATTSSAAASVEKSRESTPLQGKRVRQMKVENSILLHRISEVVERNKSLIAQLMEREMEIAKLRSQVAASELPLPPTTVVVEDSTRLTGKEETLL